MYIIDKLQRLNEIEPLDSINGVLTKYFLTHLKQIKYLTLTQCMKDTNISKASIHRFYHQAGFQSFRDFISQLAHEYEYINTKSIATTTDLSMKLDLNKDLLQTFVKDLNNAKTILFYGNATEIELLDDLIKLLLCQNIEVKKLVCWSKEAKLEMLDSLNSNDVFVVVDSTSRFSMLKEIALNQSDMLNLDFISKHNIKKYYLGPNKKSTVQDFKIIPFTKSTDSHYQSRVLLLVLGWQLVNIFKETIK